MFLAVAIGAIGLGVAVMIGYIVVQQVRTALPEVDTATNTTINNARDTVFSGLNLLVIGVIVAAAFGLIAIFGRK